MMITVKNVGDCMNWDEMIDYIKSEKIRIETENSKITIIAKHDYQDIYEVTNYPHAINNTGGAISIW